MNTRSFTQFNLDPEVIRALELLGYHSPTDVQYEVLPLALKRQDIAVKAETGSGKTASFGIPICQLVEWEENKPQALILTPTRELADQIREDITNIGRFKRIKATAIYGKSSFVKQKTELKQKNHVIVGTPGRVKDHIEKGTLDLSKVEFFVIDEADEMLNMGFIDQVEAIIKKVPVDRMTMLFSATLPEDVEKLCHKYMKTPVDIEIKSNNEKTSSIEHALYIVKQDHKFQLLQDITVMENPDSCIIFCRTKENVDTLVVDLEKQGYTCDKLHGGMVQEDRFDVMKDFKRGEFRYLVATDVAARGIDIEKISLVINYDLPMEKESYVHRIGRTGRAGKSGKAISFATPYEDKFLKDIEDYIGFQIPKMTAPTKAEVTKKQTAFKKKMDAIPELKEDKSDHLNKNIMKLYFNGGKKKKLRAVDFVGTIAKLDGVSADDIGIITILDKVSYVEILNGKGPKVLKAMKTTTIKGKQLKVHKANK